MRNERITVLNLNNRYRPIILSLNKKREDDGARDLLSDLMYFKDRYPDARIIADNSSEILYDLKEIECADPISLSDLSKYYKRFRTRKSVTTKSYSSYKEFLEYTPINISTAINAKPSYSNVTLFGAKRSSEHLTNVLNFKKNPTVYLFINRIMKLKVNEEHIVQFTDEIKKVPSDSINYKYLLKLWQEIDFELKKYPIFKLLD